LPFQPNWCIQIGVYNSHIYSGAQYVICRVKLDEGKSKHADLAQENGFGSA
jgi:hypothetical protein